MQTVDEQPETIHLYVVREKKPKPSVFPIVLSALSLIVLLVFCVFVPYQQPVTRAQVEALRGVNCESVLANLELRNLVTEVGRGTGPGQPKLYGTTMRFLQLLGLENLEELPKPALGEARRELDRSASSA